MSNETSSRYSELMDSLNRAGRIETSPAEEDVAAMVKSAIVNERPPIKLRWPRVSAAARFFTPGLSVLGGQTGARKSWAAMEIGLACEVSGERWSYLPLESDRTFYLRRLACMLSKSFDPLLTREDCPDAPARAAAAINSVADLMNHIAPHIFNNPALPSKDFSAIQVTPNWIYDWIKRRFEKGDRVAIVDPLCMIQIRGRDAWAAENDFIQGLVNIGYKHASTVVLTTHTTKRLERGKPLDVTDLQGGAAVGRNATSCLLIQAVQDESFSVCRAGGQRETVIANCVLTVGKCRNADSGQRFAFSFGRPRPEFMELGLIKK